MDEITLHELEFHRIVEDASRRAQTELGKRAILSSKPFPDIGSCTRELARVEEAMALLEMKGAPSLAGLVDIGPLLDKASKGGVLSAEELVSCAKMLQAGHEAVAFLKAFELRAPILSSEAKEIPDLGAVAERILSTFDEDLKIRSDASPRLAELRHEATVLAWRVRERIEKMLLDDLIKACLQDDYYTLRQGRYVLPVKAEDRRLVPGIIHGTSQTGATVFVEPEAIVEENNRLKWVTDQIEVEEFAILTERSSLLARYKGDCEKVSRFVEGLDALFAKARQAIELRGNYPKLTLAQDEGLFLENARNPLLHLLGRNVVPITITLPKAPCCLVISGPNAGGKTMALLTAGLCVTMARYGFLPPSGPRSVIPWYERVFTLLGEQTNLAQAVSTFTGQMRRIQAVLEALEKGQKGRTLVLIDEVATGTDPKQGEALARAILETLVEKGAECIAVTHYEAPKALAQEGKGFLNARVGLDPKTGLPTYTLEFGEPGRSNPFEAALQAGLAPEVVERARSYLDEREVRLEKALLEAEALREQLKKERAEVEAQKARAEDLRRRYERELARLRKDADRLVYEARKEALDKIRRLEEELERIAQEARREEQERRRRLIVARKEEVREKKAEVQASMEKEAELVEPIPPTPFPEKDLQVGVEVYVVPLRAVGTVVAFSQDRKRIEVQVGAMRSKVAISDLRVPQRAQKQASVPRVKGGEGLIAREERSLDVIARTTENTLDLRGLRVDEAISALERRLDQAFLRGEPGLFVIHGMGTSALRSAVRQYLKECKYPCTFRPGEQHEGGEGVTIITLKY